MVVNKKVDVCEKNYMLFWKVHKDDTECLHYSKSRYVMVVNGDGTFVTTKVVVNNFVTCCWRSLSQTDKSASIRMPIVAAFT
jgi:hypothetical protein